MFGFFKRNKENKFWIPIGFRNYLDTSYDNDGILSHAITFINLGTLKTKTEYFYDAGRVDRNIISIMHNKLLNDMQSDKLPDSSILTAKSLMHLTTQEIHKDGKTSLIPMYKKK